MGVPPQPEPDERHRVVNEGIQIFEKTHETTVTPDARQFLLNKTLIPSQDFAVALQAGKINSGEIQETIGRALVLAKQLSMKRGFDFINRDVASDACHQVIQLEMDCPWPWIIC